MKFTTTVAVTLAILGGSAATAQTRAASSDAKQDAYLNTLNAQNAAHDERRDSGDKAYHAHHAKVHDELVAARKKGDHAEVSRLEKMEASDAAHLNREHRDNGQGATHDADLVKMRKAEASDDNAEN